MHGPCRSYFVSHAFISLMMAYTIFTACIGQPASAYITIVPSVAIPDSSDNLTGIYMYMLCI